MNAALTTNEDHEFNYGVSIRRYESSSRATAKSSNTPRYSRRRGKATAQFNGMHRRRSKKIKW